MKTFSYRFTCASIEQDGEVYFFEAEHDGVRLVKIGHTVKGSKRIYQLKSDYPGGRVLAAVKGGTIEEYVLHRMFGADCHSGEWFRSTPRLMNLIAGVVIDGVLPCDAQYAAAQFRIAGRALANAEEALRARKPHQPAPGVYDPIQHARNLGEL